VKALEIAEAATDDELEIVADNGVATITVGRTTWELRLPDGSDYPPFPDVDNIGFVSVDRSRFAAALAAVRHAATAESMRQNLMMVDISGGRMRASDGVRYHQVTMPGWPDDFDTHIPIGAVEVLLKLLRSTEIEALEIADTDDQIVFRLGADVFVASKLVVAFPNVDQMLLEPAMGNDQHLVVDRTSLEGAIKRVRITADPETMAVALTMDPDHVTVRSQDKYGNTCSEVIDAQWSGDAGRTAAFNHSHLSDLVASVDTRSCSFALGKDTKQRLSPLLLRDDSSGVLGVLTQQRIDWVM
jgi:DNA polymerase III sliding clamp (beta) subunit (PCNA family)